MVATGRVLFQAAASTDKSWVAKGAPASLAETEKFYDEFVSEKENPTRLEIGSIGPKIGPIGSFHWLKLEIYFSH